MVDISLVKGRTARTVPMGCAKVVHDVVANGATFNRGHVRITLHNHVWPTEHDARIGLCIDELLP